MFFMRCIELYKKTVYNWNNFHHSGWSVCSEHFSFLLWTNIDIQTQMFSEKLILSTSGCGTIDSFCVKWTKSVLLVESFFKETEHGLCILVIQVFWTTCHSTWWRGSSVVAYWQSAYFEWTRNKILFAWSRDWTTILYLRKKVSAFHF